MKARPILMHARSIRNLVAGVKTQTRRIVKPQPPLRWTAIEMLKGAIARWGYQLPALDWHTVKCPYGAPGDLLWVRESTWLRPSRSPRDMREGADTWPRAIYQADGMWFGSKYAESDKPAYKSDVEREWCKEHGWKAAPSIHMPRWASRLTLRLTDVRVERVQSIKNQPGLEHESDIVAEGVPYHYQKSYIWLSIEFEKLWNETNGPGAWERNDWCWALTFEVVRQNIDGVLKRVAT